MDDVTLARAIHVLAVVLWIGGVALVTTVLLPAVRRFKSCRSDRRLAEVLDLRHRHHRPVSDDAARMTHFMRGGTTAPVRPDSSDTSSSASYQQAD